MTTCKDGWVKCRFCWWQIPIKLRKPTLGRMTGFDLLSAHVVARHWDELTAKEQAGLSSWRNE